MRYLSRDLRALWELVIYTGNPDAKRPKTKKETVIAINAVDAIRRAGKPVAKPPEFIDYVTWPEIEGGPIYIIKDTSGPTDIEVKPTVKYQE